MAALKTTLIILAIAGALLLSACSPGAGSAGGEEDTPTVAVEDPPTEWKVAWTRQLGSGESKAKRVAVDANGNVYVVGSVDDAALPGQISAGGVDAVVRAYDSAGRELWTRQFGTADWDVARLVRVDPAGDIYVAGNTNGVLPGQTSTSKSEDMFIRKYDPGGDELWTRQFEHDFEDDLTEVAWGATGDVYVIGGEVSEEYGFIRKYDAAGEEVWTDRFPLEEATAYSWRYEVDNAGNFYLAGESRYQENTFVRKYGPSGDELWTAHVGSDNEDVAGIAVDDAGGVYVTGLTRAGTEDLFWDHAFVSKFDASGRHLWTGQFPEELHESAWGMAVDTDGNVYVVGYDRKSELPRPYLVRKYAR